MKSILQDWVMGLGLRHQGVLVSAVRGCDTVSRDNPVKLLIRCYRGAVLNAHCGDPAKARSYIEQVPDDVLTERMNRVIKDHDEFPHHYLMHLIHAAEIVGYKHPGGRERVMWSYFYRRMVAKLHFEVEEEAQLDLRLNADEETFLSKQ